MPTLTSSYHSSTPETLAKVAILVKTEALLRVTHSDVFSISRWRPISIKFVEVVLLIRGPDA